MVHAARRFERDFEPNNPLRLILDDEFGGHWARDLPTGALIGMVNVVDCLPTQPLVGDAAAGDAVLVRCQYPQKSTLSLGRVAFQGGQ